MHHRFIRQCTYLVDGAHIEKLLALHQLVGSPLAPLHEALLGSFLD
jgi:hypothetical protein